MWGAWGSLMQRVGQACMHDQSLCTVNFHTGWRTFIDALLGALLALSSPSGSTMATVFIERADAAREAARWKSSFEHAAAAFISPAVGIVRTAPLWRCHYKADQRRWPRLQRL